MKENLQLIAVYKIVLYCINMEWEWKKKGIKRIQDKKKERETIEKKLKHCIEFLLYGLGLVFPFFLPFYCLQNVKM